MISWIQRTFQRHFKLVFLLLLAAMVIPLIFIYSASGGFGRDERATRTFRLFGVTLNSDQERQLHDDSALSLYLASGNPYFNSENVQIYSYQRAAALQMADKLGLPKATPQQIREFLQTLRGFAGQDGNFDPQRYAQLLDNVQSSARADRGQLARVIADDWRIALVERTIGGPGYILDDELKRMLARADTRWSVQAATLDLSKIAAPREPTDDELRHWYDTNTFRYQVPDRTRVKHVEFRAADFAAKVQLSESEITEYFEANKARYRKPAPPPAEGQAPATPADPSLAEVRDQVVRDLTAKNAATLAAKAANDFAYVLFTQNIVQGSEAFEKLLAAKDLALQSPEPFTADTAPAGTGWTPQILSIASQLNEKHPVSDVLTAGDNNVVLFFQERLPAYTPEFSSVRDRVLADVREDLRQKAVVARGEELRRQLADAVKSGKSFADAAKAAGLEAKSWENFTLRSPPADLDYGVRSRLDDLRLAEVSAMSVQENRGTFTLLTGRQVPEVATTGEQFEQTRRAIMAQASQVAAQDVLGDVVQKELTAAGLTRDRE